MTKQHRPYHKVGYVDFPTNNPSYRNLADITPERAGVMLVRLLVEDTTIDGRYQVESGPPNAVDDFILGCDKFATAKEAHEYFSGPRKIVSNTLLGAIDWCGVSLVEGTLNVAEFFHCTFEDLNPEAQRMYRELEATVYPGATLWLVTSMNKNRQSVEDMMLEVRRTGLPLAELLPETSEKKSTVVLCRECDGDGKQTIKPHIGARRLGWKRASPGHWRCPDHAANAATDVSVH